MKRNTKGYDYTKGITGLLTAVTLLSVVTGCGGALSTNPTNGSEDVSVNNPLSSGSALYQQVPTSPAELDLLQVDVLKTLYELKCEGDDYEGYKTTIEKYLNTLTDKISKLQGGSYSEFVNEINAIRDYVDTLAKQQGDFSQLDQNNQEVDQESNKTVDDVSVPFYQVILNSIVDHIEFNVNEGKDALEDLEFLEDYLKYFAEKTATLAKEVGLVDNKVLYTSLFDKEDLEKFKKSIEGREESIDDIHNPLRLGIAMFNYWNGDYVLIDMPNNGNLDQATTPNEDIEPEEVKENIKQDILEDIKTKQ